MSIFSPQKAKYFVSRPLLRCSIIAVHKAQSYVLIYNLLSEYQLNKLVRTYYVTTNLFLSFILKIIIKIVNESLNTSPFDLIEKKE